MVCESGFFMKKGGGSRWEVELKVKENEFILTRTLYSRPLKNYMDDNREVIIDEVVSPEAIFEDFEPQDDGARYIVRKLERMNLENYNFVYDGF